MPEATTRVEREARLRWVPINRMKVSPTAQRELNEAWVDRLAMEMELESLGYPTVNHRDDHYYVIDGQHRIEALRKLGFTDEKVECWTYEGMAEEDEAERFLKLNNKLTIETHAKFRVAVAAGRDVQCDIERIVRANGCVISKDNVPGAIGAVGTLERIYRRSDPKTLARTIRIVRDAYGDAGMEAPVLDGIGLLCQRYNGSLDDLAAVEKLAGANGGPVGLLGRAEVTRRQTGQPKAHCVAAAAVEFINSGKGGKKLPSWWKA